MPFSDMFDKRAGRLLSGAIKNDRVANAYLFLSSSEKQSFDAAHSFALALHCEKENADFCKKCSACLKVQELKFSDLVVVEPEGESIGIDQVRRIKEIVKYGPAQSKFLTVIIRQADKLTTQAANSLLKVLEEPVPGVCFILLAELEEAIISTVLSRCQRIYLEAPRIETEKDGALDILEMGKKDLIERLFFSRQIKPDRQEVRKFLIKSLAYCWQDIAQGFNSGRIDFRKVAALEAMSEAYRALHRRANIRLVLDLLFLRLEGA